MSATKTRKVAQLLMDRYGIQDNQLALEIVQVVMTPEAIQDKRPSWNHPAVLLAKRLTGKQVPPAMIDEIIRVLGDNPDEKRAADCHLQMVKRGYEGAWYWLDDYAGARRPASTRGSLPATQTTAFEWVE